MMQCADVTSSVVIIFWMFKMCEIGESVLSVITGADDVVDASFWETSVAC